MTGTKSWANILRLAGLVLLLIAPSCSDPAPSEEDAQTSDSAARSGGLQSSSYALVGRQAPDFTLPLLQGGQVTLSEHFGKDIVILDFWATWCSPCRAVMPLLEETAADFADQGVILYSVNWAQDAQTIKDYLEEVGLHSQVLLDLDTEVGMNKYQVEGLPATVVIGREGEVKSFLKGLSAVQSGLRTVLQELTAESADNLSGGGDGN